MTLRLDPEQLSPVYFRVKLCKASTPLGSSVILRTTHSWYVACPSPLAGGAH